MEIGVCGFSTCFVFPIVTCIHIYGDYRFIRDTFSFSIENWLKNIMPRNQWHIVLGPFVSKWHCIHRTLFVFGVYSFCQALSDDINADHFFYIDLDLFTLILLGLVVQQTYLVLFFFQGSLFFQIQVLYLFKGFNSSTSHNYIPILN